MKTTKSTSLACQPAGRDELDASNNALADLDIKVELIQMLIPLALERVNELLQEEVTALAGRRYGRDATPYRWGKQRGSVYLGEQKVPIAALARCRASSGSAACELPALTSRSGDGWNLVSQDFTRPVLSQVQAHRAPHSASLWRVGEHGVTPFRACQCPQAPPAHAASLGRL